MNLLENSAQIVEQIGRLEENRDLEQQRAAIATRAAEFQKISQRLIVSSERVKALKKRDIPIDLNESARSAPGVKQFIQDWRSRIKSDPNEIIGDANAAIRLKIVDPLKTLSVALDQSSARAWKEYVDDKLPKVGPETLELLKGLSNQRQIAVEFSNSINKARERGSNVPLTDDQFEDFERLASSCQRQWEAFDFKELAPDVRKFLQAASSPAGALIDHLTADVVAWLRQHGLADNFRVRNK